MKLTKEIKDLHTKIYKTTMNETAEDAHKGKDALCLWVEKISVSILSKVIYGVYM